MSETLTYGIFPIEAKLSAAKNARSLRQRVTEKPAGKPFNPGTFRPAVERTHFVRQVGPAFSGSEPIPTRRR